MGECETPRDAAPSSSFDDEFRLGDLSGVVTRADDPYSSEEADSFLMSSTGTLATNGEFESERAAVECESTGASKRVALLEVGSSGCEIEVLE